jgi:hypothetical protein
VPIGEQQKADKPSKTGMMILGIALVVSVLGNFALLNRGKPIKGNGEMSEEELEEILAALTAIRNTHPTETATIAKNFQKQLDMNSELRRTLRENNNFISTMSGWIGACNIYAVNILAGKELKDRTFLKKLANNNRIEYFQTIPAPIMDDAF